MSKETPEEYDVDVHIMNWLRLIPFLPSEIIRRTEKTFNGNICLTTFRVLFYAKHQAQTISIPINLIRRSESSLANLNIVTNIGTTFVCSFTNLEQCEKWASIISIAIESSKDLVSSFAMSYRKALQLSNNVHPFLLPLKIQLELEDSDNVLDVALVLHEFQRLEFNKEWKVTDVNSEFKVCPSYPKYHIMPREIKDVDIPCMATFRSHNRFPSVIWRSKKNGAVLLRCAQPCVGIMYSRNELDESFVEAVLSNCRNDPRLEKGIEDPRRLLIVDARHYSVAQLNRLRGGGFEYIEYYDQSQIKFMDLPNLHSVRVSFERVVQLYDNKPSNWFSALEKTLWLQYISQLLQSASEVATALDTHGRPVMVHCTDGWDRTPQLTSLAKVILDPYYRTIQGFRILIEHEWLQFGHKFGDRCGNGATFCSPEERSPIFLQWLDCIRQIQCQFPSYFEFNELFLIKLAMHLYSGLFGTFLYNSERERNSAQIHSQTCSVWAFLNPTTNWSIRNFLYEKKSENVIKPAWQVRNLVLWDSLYQNALLPCSAFASICGSKEDKNCYPLINNETPTVVPAKLEIIPTSTGSSSPPTNFSFPAPASLDEISHNEDMFRGELQRTKSLTILPTSSMLQGLLTPEMSMGSHEASGASLITSNTLTLTDHDPYQIRTEDVDPIFFDSSSYVTQNLNRTSCLTDSRLRFAKFGCRSSTDLSWQMTKNGNIAFNPYDRRFNSSPLIDISSALTYNQNDLSVCKREHTRTLSDPAHTNCKTGKLNMPVSEPISSQGCNAANSHVHCANLFDQDEELLAESKSEGDYKVSMLGKSSGNSPNVPVFCQHEFRASTPPSRISSESTVSRIPSSTNYASNPLIVSYFKQLAFSNSYSELGQSIKTCANSSPPEAKMTTTTSHSNAAKINNSSLTNEDFSISQIASNLRKSISTASPSMNNVTDVDPICAINSQKYLTFGSPPKNLDLFLNEVTTLDSLMSKQVLSTWPSDLDGLPMRVDSSTLRLHQMHCQRNKMRQFHEAQVADLVAQVEADKLLISNLKAKLLQFRRLSESKMFNMESGEGDEPRPTSLISNRESFPTTYNVDRSSKRSLEEILSEAMDGWNSSYKDDDLLELACGMDIYPIAPQSRRRITSREALYSTSFSSDVSSFEVVDAREAQLGQFPPIPLAVSESCSNEIPASLLSNTCENCNRVFCANCLNSSTIDRCMPIMRPYHCSPNCSRKLSDVYNFPKTLSPISSSLNISMEQFPVNNSIVTPKNNEQLLKRLGNQYDMSQFGLLAEVQEELPCPFAVQAIQPNQVVSSAHSSLSSDYSSVSCENLISKNPGYYRCLTVDGRTTKSNNQNQNGIARA